MLDRAMTAENAQNLIVSDLLRVGVRAGGVLLVHSSLSSLGYVPGGPETVIRGLIEALGPEGTLLLPAFSYQHVGPNQATFDVLRTPSNVGAIPEYFRTRPGTFRSVCPTHAVCGVGPRTQEMLAEHHLDDTPCGPHSPFRKLREVGGQILFLGCGMRPNTSMHAVEELARPPYLFAGPIVYHVIWPDGVERDLCHIHHDFVGYEQRYDRLEPLLVPGEELHTGQVLAAGVHLVEAPAMWEKALAAYQRDALYFVDHTR